MFDLHTASLVDCVTNGTMRALALVMSVILTPIDIVIVVGVPNTIVIYIIIIITMINVMMIIAIIITIRPRAFPFFIVLLPFMLAPPVTTFRVTMSASIATTTALVIIPPMQGCLCLLIRACLSVHTHTCSRQPPNHY